MYEDALTSKWKLGALGSEVEVADVSSVQTLTNKTIDADSNTITNIENADIKAAAGISVNKLATLTASRAVVSDGSGFISASTATSTEVGHLSGVTSAIQTQIDGKITNPGTTNGDVMYYNGTSWVRLGIGSAGQFLTVSGGVPAWASGSSTLQQAYDNSTVGEIVLNGTQGAFEIRDNATPIGADLLAVSSNDGATDYFKVTAAAVTATVRLS